MSRPFQPLLTWLCLDFLCVTFEEGNIYAQLWNSCWNFMHKHLPLKPHVQIHSLCYQHAKPLAFGPHMRLYRPMHGGPKASCTQVLPCLAFISAINTMLPSFKPEPEGNLKLCWSEIPTILKEILIFISQFQTWISTQSVDLQVSNRFLRSIHSTLYS